MSDAPAGHTVRERIVARIPLPWGIDCGPGWLELIGELDDKLAALFPDYALYQCKEKFGALRYYTDIGETPPEFSCCQQFRASDPEPNDDEDWHQWTQRFNVHDATPIHRHARADYDADVASARALIRTAEVQSATVCELCGAPGVLVGDNWYAVRCAEHRTLAIGHAAKVAHHEGPGAPTT